MVFVNLWCWNASVFSKCLSIVNVFFCFSFELGSRNWTAASSRFLKFFPRTRGTAPCDTDGSVDESPSKLSFCPTRLVEVRLWIISCGCKSNASALVFDIVSWLFTTEDGGVCVQNNCKRCQSWRVEQVSVDPKVWPSRRSLKPTKLRNIPDISKALYHEQPFGGRQKLVFWPTAEWLSYANGYDHWLDHWKFCFDVFRPSQNNNSILDPRWNQLFTCFGLCLEFLQAVTACG